MSNLIENYLQDSTNKSNAGYSVKCHSKNNNTAGNKIVTIENNNLKTDVFFLFQQVG